MENHHGCWTNPHDYYSPRERCLCDLYAFVSDRSASWQLGEGSTTFPSPMMDLFDNISTSLQQLESPISHMYPQNIFLKVKTSLALYIFCLYFLSLFPLLVKAKEREGLSPNCSLERLSHSWIIYLHTYFLCANSIMACMLYLLIVMSWHNLIWIISKCM